MARNVPASETDDVPNKDVRFSFMCSVNSKRLIRQKSVKLCLGLQRCAIRKVRVDGNGAII